MTSYRYSMFHCFCAFLIELYFYTKIMNLFFMLKDLLKYCVIIGRLYFCSLYFVLVKGHKHVLEM